MNTLLKSMAIGLSLIAGSQAMEPTKRTAFDAELDQSGGDQKRLCIRTSAETNYPLGYFIMEVCPKEVRTTILQDAAMNNCYELGHVGNMELVCKDWYSCIKKHQYPKMSLNKKFNFQKIDDAYLYEIFLNCGLIYTRDDGRLVELPFKTLENPLEGTLDLSDCDDAGKYLSINTGYRKAQNPDNRNKIEVWICLRSLLLQNLKGNASHFHNLMNENLWEKSAPIGFFWTWGGWDIESYEHMCKKAMCDITTGHLYNKWYDSRPIDDPQRMGEGRKEARLAQAKFTLFLNKKSS